MSLDYWSNRWANNEAQWHISSSEPHRDCLGSYDKWIKQTGYSHGCMHGLFLKFSCNM